MYRPFVDMDIRVLQGAKIWYRDAEAEQANGRELEIFELRKWTGRLTKKIQK
jgi:hypothetical protein